MMAQDWGSQAADAAAAMGVSATALAATCVMESNCQNVGAASGSSATGAFQMINSTYTADISGAVAYDPDIAGSIVSGLAGQMDPATEAYAASYELRSDALLLQPKTSMILRYSTFGRFISLAPGWDRRSRPLTTRKYRRAHGTERGFTRCKWSPTSSTVGNGGPPSSRNSAPQQQIKTCWLNNMESVMKAAVFVSSIVALLAFSEAHGEPEGETVSGFQCVGINIPGLHLTPTTCGRAQGFPGCSMRQGTAQKQSAKSLA